MTDNRIRITQIGNHGAVAAIDAFLSRLNGWVRVYGNLHREALKLRLAGSRTHRQRPPAGNWNSDRLEEDTKRIRYNSRTFECARPHKCLFLEERFG